MLPEGSRERFWGLDEKPGVSNSPGGDWRWGFLGRKTRISGEKVARVSTVVLEMVLNDVSVLSESQAAEALSWPAGNVTVCKVK